MANNVPFGQGLTPDAKKVWGFPETVTMTKAEAEEVTVKVDESIQGNPGAYNMEIDSPKEFWDVLGHVKLSFYADGIESVQEIIANTFELWRSLKETYAGEFAAKEAEDSKASKAQLDLIGRLTDNQTVPTNLTKDEASRMIEELKSRPRQEAGQQPYDRQQNQAAGRQAQEARWDDRAGRSGPRPISQKQIDLIRKLAKPVPADLDQWDSQQASGLIKQLLGR